MAVIKAINYKHVKISKSINQNPKHNLYLFMSLINATKTSAINNKIQTKEKIEN